MKLVGKFRTKLLLLFCMLLVLIAGSITGCGKKENYLDVTKGMLGYTSGTWAGTFSWVENGNKMSIDYKRLLGQSDVEVNEFVVSINDTDTVIFNFVTVEGVCYLKLNDLRDSLSGCSSETLKEYASLVPNNIAYASSENWVFDSFYSELSETESGVYGLPTYIERCELMMNMFLGSLDSKGALEYKGSDGTYTVSSKDNLSSILVQMLREVDTYYDNFGSNITSLELASDYEIDKGIVNEKDNFLASLSDVQNKYILLGSDSMNAVLSGSTTVFDGDSGREIDGNLELSWLSDSNGSESKIQWAFKYIPTSYGYEWTKSTNIDVSEFNSTYFYLNDLFEDVLREGNFLGGHYLDADLSSSDSLLQRELDLSVKKYLGIDSSVADYIGSNNSEPSVLSLMNILDTLVGGFKVEVEVPTEVDEIDKYNVISGELQEGIEYVICVDEVESDSKILSVNCRVLNNTEGVFKCKTKDFKLKDLGTSLVSANISSQLLEVNPDFDTSKYEDTVSLDSGCFKDFKLYFVLPEESGYLDIFLSDDVLGNLVSF